MIESHPTEKLAKVATEDDPDWEEGVADDDVDEDDDGGVSEFLKKMYNQGKSQGGGIVDEHHRHGCQMAIARFLDRMCLALRA